MLRKSFLIFFSFLRHSTVKGATNLYFMHYLWVVIIPLNTDLHNSLHLLPILLKIFVRTKRMAKHLLMSERTFFLIVFKYFKSCSFIIVYKEKCCASTNKNSSANLISMIKGALCLWYGIWEFHFGPLVFTFYFNIDISTVELKK